ARAIGFRAFLPMDRATLLVCQDSALAAHAFGAQDSHHARRPDHSGGMKLNELHIDEFRTGLVRQRVSITCIFPTVAGDFVRATDSDRGHYRGFSAGNFARSPLAL